VQSLAPRDFVFAATAALEGRQGFFRRLERKRYKVQARVLIARYRRFDPCPDYARARLRAEARWVRVGDIPRYALLPEGGLCSTTVFCRDLSG
jgi:hypothetical protein